ncbi:hypothetical protein MnTg02_02989 [bacterium MnTg02]|nr:hypothetical protein MnTg02_02989 [bacterium MnTg02]
MILVELRSPFQQTRMQIENITGIGLAPWRAAKQQRHLPVGHRLLGEIIIGDERVHAIVAEIFTHGAAGIRRQELHRRRVRGGRGNDD